MWRECAKQPAVESVVVTFHMERGVSGSKIIKPFHSQFCSKRAESNMQQETHRRRAVPKDAL